MKRYWLVKSEPYNYSIEDLESDATTQWTGVRNYQARNFLRDMEVGEDVLFYHSVVEPVGIVGVAKVKRKAYPDVTQFDKRSEYFDPKATKESPRWFAPDLGFVRKFKVPLPLKDLRSIKELKKMELLRRGSRLSVQPVSKEEFSVIITKAK